jgi:hypothetical protein
VETLNVVVWSWGTKYGREYVERLFAGVHRHLARPFMPWVFHPNEADHHLTQIPGCFARLRMFDPAFQRHHGLKGRVVCLDLDAIVTGPLDQVFDRDEDFVILQGANASNPCPYNGSLMSFRVGAHPDIWEDFSLDAVKASPKHEFHDDQGWYWHKISDAAGWTAGPESGVYAFQKPGWPKGEKLPEDASLVVLPGWRDPAKFTHLDWVKEHWA